MEGGVEGMVAVVSWLSDAGLAFNLLRNSRQCRHPEKLTAPRPSRNPSNAVASQTVSEHNYKRRRLSAEPYASTYQVSHCGVDDRFPACEHTEFPPQRQKPSSEFGNFEVGYIRCHSPARSDIQNYRGNADTPGSRGLQFRVQQERDVDAFVNSLRKYPGMTKHIPSTELLEQLLKTSRNYSPKQSHAPAPSKKRRHHWDKPRPFASLNPYAHKQKESYRRSRKKKYTNAHINSKEKEYSLQGGLVRLIPSVTAFDYLNSGARSSTGNLAKRIENTILKNVFREKNRNKGKPVTTFPVCPILQSRYEKHLKKYHATTSKTPHVDLENLPTCSKCKLKRPCPCEAAKRAGRIVDEDVHQIRQLEDAIFSWLKDIPVYPNENPQDKFIRDDIVKKLAVSLSQFNDADFSIKGREEIKQALDKMPMWYPKGEKERENFKNDIIDNLLDRIKGVQEMKMFNQAIRDFFDDIKFGKEIDAEQALDDIIRELNKIALNRPENNDVYRDLLKMKAFELLDGLQIKSNGNKYEYLNKLSNDLADRLLNVSIKSIDEEHKVDLDKAIKNMLDETNVRIKDRDNVEKKLQAVIADVVAQNIDKDEATIQIKSILDGKVPESEIENIANKTLTLAEISHLDAIQIDPETIAEDIRDILDLSNIQIKNRADVEKKLSQLVSDITTKGIEENKAKSIIKSILKGNIPLDKLEEITEQVLTLADRVKPIDDETKQEIKGDVRDILSDVEIKNRGKVEEHLSKLIADITAKGIDNDQAETQIKAFLKGKVSEDALEDITEQALKLADRVKPLDTKTKQIIKEDLQDIFDSSNIQIKNRGKVEENLIKLVANISKGMNKDKAVTQIKSLLKDTVPENKQEEITKKVLLLATKIKPEVKSIDPETKRHIDKQISDILYQSEPDIKDKRKVEEKLRILVSDILMKRIGRDKAKQSIKSILKGKIPEDKVENTTLKVLDLTKNIEDNQSMQYPISEETLKDDISEILDRTNVRIKNRDKVEKHIRDIVSDLVMRGLDKSKAQDDINSTLRGNVPDSQVEDISKEIFALAENLSRSYSEYSGGPVASSTQNEEKILFDQVFEVIRNWLKNLNIHLGNNKLNEVAEAIATETLDRRKYLQLNPGVQISEAKESEILKENIYKVLNNLIDKKMVQAIMTQADDLMNSLKQLPTFQVSKEYNKGLVQNSMPFVQESLEGALLNWLRQSPIYINNDLRNKQTQEQIILELAESLAAVLGSHAIQKPGTNLDEVLLKEISKHIERFPLGPEFKSKEYIRKLCNNILDYLKKIQLFQDTSARDSQRTKSSFLSSTNQLNDIVKDWCDALPLSDTDEAFRIKQDLANRIILKVGELNMNQDIFNDDLLYDEILQDFIDQQINELPMETNVTDVSKKLLIDQIKQIKQKIQDDFIGRKYKQQLRDTISNVLPSIACPTAEDLSSFELMKENLADAFINLNYSVEDDTARAKFKRRIMDEVNKYVNDYLKRCPATPVSTRKLNEDLYNALKNVPVPGDESMRTEVESLRMKDVINDWLKTLPMSRQSISEQLHTNKVVTLMAQKLQELENEFHPDFEEIAVAEVATYLKKLPLKNKNNLQEMAKKLVEKIRNTAESRAFVEGTRSKLTDDCLCEDFALPSISKRISYPSCASFIPPCGLSKEDQEKMQQIRERAVLCEAGTQSRRCRDAAVNPPPLNHESQTDMPCNNNKYCQHAEKPEHVCSKSATLRTKRIPISTRPCTSTEGQADCSPYVVVKEYYWDSNLGNKVDFATQTPVEESGRVCIPSSFLNTERLCRPRSSLTSRRIPVKPRSRPEASTCQRPTPRRQFTSACPNEFFNRPKHCPRSPLVPDYLRSSYRCVRPSCSRKKSPCLSCKRDPTTICDKCFPMHVCPHPTCLYFK